MLHSLWLVPGSAGICVHDLLRIAHIGWVRGAGGDALGHDLLKDERGEQGILEGFLLPQVLTVVGLVGRPGFLVVVFVESGY